MKFAEDPKKYGITKMIESMSFEMGSQPMKDRIDRLILTVEDEPNLKERRMVLRGPFWIILKYKHKNPYFAMFVKKATDLQDK